MQKYSIGLDIGTNSVGWAVVDENNNIVKKNGFDMWGVRMFEESQDASARRTYRTSRRRLERRKQRIKLLQDLFSNEISNVDKNFYQRLNDSFYKMEDKELNNKYTFFDDEKTDKWYFNTYPTIYHLRKDLMESDEKKDIRLLYLAIHHIVKYRGNFLQEGEIFNKSDSSRIVEDFNQINNQLIAIREDFEEDDELNYFDDIKNVNEDFINKLELIINEKTYKKDKKQKLETLFGCEKTSFVNDFIIPLLCGSTVNPSSFKIVKDMKYDKVEIDLSSEELDNKIDEAKKGITELSSLFDLTYVIKDIYDYYYLVKLLGKSNSLSDAMVEVYNQHQSDLKILKEFIKTYCKNEYDKCFRIHENDVNNYCAYVGYNSTSKELSRFKHCAKENFYKYIKDIILKVEKPEAAEVKKYILNKIENNEFLLRQNSGQNSTIPMQLHLIELRKILENQSKYYDFLNQTEDGYTVKEKIESIFKFKIPYYVGPLNNKSNNSWVERTNEKIYPWNFNEVVNLDESAKKFIQRMQNKCTYLHGDNDYCLPKKSLLYSEFTCLQYLNKVTIDNKLLPAEMKMNIFDNVFCVYAKPTRKSIESYLKNNYGISFDRFTSKIDDVACDMSSYITFKDIFGNEFDRNRDLVEEIIKDITIFEDKKILEKRLVEIYKLDENKVKRIKSLNYKGYGSLCKNLLSNLVYKNKTTGEVFGPIIKIMRESNMNLQEILYCQDYPFIEAIDEYNKNQTGKNNKLTAEEFVDEYLYISPGFKRPLIQSYKIIEEVETILKQKIDSFYVECAKTNKAEKVKKLSRYEKVKDLFKECRKISQQLSQYNIDINHLNQVLENNKDSLRSDKIYLYLTQLGKDLYTMEDMSLEDVIAGIYDIDHIYPQSIIKDDSISNRVLVNKHFNQTVKSNKFLCEISNSLAKNRIGFYQFLLDSSLITKEKFRRLTEKEILPEKLDGFVNRQIVATNQAVKGIITLLKEYKNVDSSKIIYSKAENISDFRKEYEILKSRTANNYHHAHDAYLNVVVGRTLDKYYKYFSFNRFNDYARLKDAKASANPMVILSKDRIYNNKIIWKQDETIKLLKDNIYNNFNIHETTRTYVSNAMFNKVTILPAPQGAVPMKEDKRGNIEKYGGITSGAYAKYAIVKVVGKKDKVDYLLVAVPRNCVDNIQKYLENLYQNKYNSFEIINDSIKVNTVVEMEKRRFCITGTANCGKILLLKNQKDRNFDKESIRIIKNIDKYYLLKKYDVTLEEENDNIILSRGTKDQKEIRITLDDCDYLKKAIINLYSKDIYNYSVIKNIIDNFKNYTTLNIKDYISTLNEILSLLKCNERATADLVSIGLSKNSGTLTIGQTLQPNTKFVETSITGYYRKVIFKVPNGI